MQIKIGTKEKIISSIDEFYLDNDLLSKTDWIEKEIDGKINNCKKRTHIEWIPRLRERGLDIPADEGALVSLINSQPDYKNRVDRDEEKEA